jgi:N-acetylglucosaminyldiphosphoundecaprenol N-acetyl-beta-D-mannosaminyltransferase
LASGTPTGSSHVRKRAVLGTEIAVVDYDAALDRIDAMVEGDERGYVCTVSAHGLVEAREDVELSIALSSAEMCVPDGMPVVWALRALGEDIDDRVYGPTLMERCCERLARRGRRIWLYGGHDDEAHAALRAELERRYPGIVIAGGWVPPFRDLGDAELGEVAERIDADEPDVVWVGISTPRQEKLLARIRPRLYAPVLVSVGAAFDFIPGRVPQAPPWMQQRGLEWAYRLSREPARLGPRYAKINPRFAAAVFRQVGRERRARSAQRGPTDPAS